MVAEKIRTQACSTPGGERGIHSKSTTILVVDDSIVVRSILRTALIGQKYDVVSARDANEAITVMNSNDTLDLIITDFHMPGLDGAAFIEVVRRHSRYRDVPILVLTAGADQMDKQRARNAGATGWIVKPFDTAKLATAINLLIAEHRPASRSRPGQSGDKCTSQNIKTVERKTMLKVCYHASNGLIETTVEGPSDREGVETYLYSLMSLMEKARADWGRYWHLVDARALQLQSAEALGSLSGASMENMAPSDRTAVVMTSEAAIKQMEDMPSQMMSRVFRELDTAREWILRKGDC